MDINNLLLENDNEIVKSVVRLSRITVLEKLGKLNLNYSLSYLQRACCKVVIRYRFCDFLSGLGKVSFLPFILNKFEDNSTLSVKW